MRLDSSLAFLFLAAVAAVLVACEDPSHEPPALDGGVDAPAVDIDTITARPRCGWESPPICPGSTRPYCAFGEWVCL